VLCHDSHDMGLAGAAVAKQAHDFGVRYAMEIRIEVYMAHSQLGNRRDGFPVVSRGPASS
jgi:hypothetical protein